MSFPAARTRSSSLRFTFMGYSRSAILILIESSSINLYVLLAQVSYTLIDFPNVFVYFPFQLRNTSVFRVYIVYNFSDFNLIFKIGKLVFARFQALLQFKVLRFQTR